MKRLFVVLSVALFAAALVSAWRNQGGAARTEEGLYRRNQQLRSGQLLRPHWQRCDDR